ncbi:hypothetical protein HT576_01570 [Haloterrigena sp. SYSU A121-1]|uniref:Uncharacterized protein n=1 Tax=Haloterrigena gelatinilytica TaxID=2741724 RepID=A0A8J8KA18_9EURY|nr:hypothetical protein [Haloterrigena gelatinilytica]NUB89725.1 hypothetical protein [Haloterrigena gelatinilytica]
MTPDTTRDDALLTPDDLEVTPDNETVEQLDENRYVVLSESSSDLDSLPSPSLDGDIEAAAAGERTRQPADSGLESDGELEFGSDGSDADTHESDDRLTAASEPHGVDITLKTDGEIAHHRATSHDVREVFVDLLTWYAGQLDDDMTPSEALQVMLAASDLEV